MCGGVGEGGGFCYVSYALSQFYFFTLLLESFLF